MRRGPAWRLGAACGVARVAVALVVAAAVVPVPAAADESLTASGSLTYTWQGDPARGCAAEDLCGVQGALVVQANGGESASASKGNTPIDLNFSGGTVRVLGAPGGACVDVPGGFIGSSLSVTHARGGQLVGRVEPPLDSGRCAGPTEQDLAQLTLPVSKTGKKRASFDLRSTQTFGAGPFSGTLVSTVVLRPATTGGFTASASASGGSGSSSGSFFPPALPPARGHKVLLEQVTQVLLEQVTLAYKLTSLPGALDVAFAGEPDPFCEALGSCGTSGSLVLSLSGLDRTVSITASRVVGRRVGARQALADLRRGRLRFEPGVSAPTPGSPTAQVIETFQAPDGSRCADTTAANGALLSFDAAPGGRGLLATLIDSTAGGLVRTHCPGPADSDVFGSSPGNPFGGGGVASGPIAPAALASGQIVVSLANPGSFTGVGYAGTRSGAIPLSLSFERVVQAGTIEVMR
jgi:hypothetical protein